jgi:hypothetical protein
MPYHSAGIRHEDARLGILASRYQECLAIGSSVVFAAALICSTHRGGRRPQYGGGRSQLQGESNAAMTIALSDEEPFGTLDDPTPWCVRTGTLGVVVPDLRAALTMARAQVSYQELTVRHLTDDQVIEFKQLLRLWFSLPMN